MVFFAIRVARDARNAVGITVSLSDVYSSVAAIRGFDRCGELRYGAMRAQTMQVVVGLPDVAAKIDHKSLYLNNLDWRRSHPLCRFLFQRKG